MAAVYVFGILLPSVGSGGNVVASGSYDTRPSVQTMALLDPHQTANPMKAAGGGSIKVADGVVLQPEISPAGANAGKVWVDDSDEIVKYVVRPGDTPGGIAEMYSISVDTLRWQNDIGEEEYLHAGEILEILPVDGVTHTVKDGDTISDIADRYGVKAKRILSFNDLSSSKSLSVDDELIVPGGELRESVSAPSSEGTHQQSSGTSRIVRPQKGGSYDLGGFIFPCDCTVTQGHGNSLFAERSGYYGSSGHSGVDFSSGRGTGTPLVAVADGTVIKVDSHGYNGGYGKYVKIRHADGSESLYAHNSRNAVRAGQNVKQGQVIAYMGTTGRVTGPHVHLELTDKPRDIFYTTFSGAKGW